MTTEDLLILTAHREGRAIQYRLRHRTPLDAWRTWVPIPGYEPRIGKDPSIEWRIHPSPRVPL